MYFKIGLCMIILTLMAGVHTHAIINDNDFRHESSEVKLVVNGKEKLASTTVVTKNGRLLIEVRGIFEAIDASLTWNQSKRTVRATRGTQTVELKVDSKTAYVNNTALYMDIPPFIINNRTMVPLRFITEAFGGVVHFDKAENVINLSISEHKEKIKIFINDSEMSFLTQPTISNGRLLVGMREMFEAIGATVSWDSGTETIHATRKGSSLSLTIGSTESTKNGITIYLDVPPSINEGRTMVPLRYIGEAFNGIVNYDSNKREIVVIVPEKSVMKLPDMVVYLNNNEVHFKDTPIFKDGRNYIPLKSILGGLGEHVTWEQVDDRITITFDGIRIFLYLNQNIVIFNGEKKYPDAYPIEQDGVIMAPVNLIADAFGGIAHYVEETKVTHLYINRPKFKTKFLQKETDMISVPTVMATAKPADNRRLFVSDNPEVLNRKTVPNRNGVLWNEIVESREGQGHRVFGWHINEFLYPIKMAITIENLSKKEVIHVKDIKGINRLSSNTWAIYDIGLPLAEAVLGGTLQEKQDQTVIVEKGETAVIKEFEVDGTHSIGFLYDFSVEPPQGKQAKYRIRTVYSRNGVKLENIDSSLVNLDEESNHPRGSWGFSTLETTLPRYKLGGKEVVYSISNGISDDLYTPVSSFDSENATRNQGHFGSVYHVKIPIEKGRGQEGKVSVRVSSRGGLYAGAVRVEGTTYMIPVIEPFKESTEILVFDPARNKEFIEFDIMHAGGSSLALAIEVSSVSP